MGARYLEYRPPAALARFVECFWTVEPSDANLGHLVLPDGCVDIVYSQEMADVPQLVGVMTGARKFTLAAGQMGLRFRPAMSQAFLPLPGAVTTDQLISLSDIWGTDARRLSEQIAEARSVAQCIEAIEGRLRNPGETTLVQRISTAIVEQAGQVRIDDLAFQAGLSARQLRRLFLEQVGLSPKHFCRVIRFRTSLARMSPSGQADWAQLALDCGYYDQAHFINEFREFSGYTPAEFATLDR